jgi:hypothetical protein
MCALVAILMRLGLSVYELAFQYYEWTTFKYYYLFVMDQFYFQVMLTLFFYVIYSWQVIKSMNPAHAVQPNAEGNTMQTLIRQKRI